MTDKQKAEIEALLRKLDRRSKRWEEREEEAEKAGDKEKAAKYHLRSECADSEWIGIEQCLKILGYCVRYPLFDTGFKNWDDPKVERL